MQRVYCRNSIKHKQRKPGQYIAVSHFVIFNQGTQKMSEADFCLIIVACQLATNYEKGKYPSALHTSYAFRGRNPT
jgi:hypothetical protein